MKKLFTLFMMSMFAAITSAFAEDKTSTWTMNTADGIAEITVEKQGTSGEPGGDLELTKDGIIVTSAKGYFKGSGSNGIQIYKTGTMTVTAPANHVIKSIVFQYPKDCYPFVEAVNEGGSSTTKTPAQVDVTFTAETPANAFTFTNVAGGQTKVKKMVITYAEASTPAAGWDGTVTTSMDNGVITKLSDLDGLKLTFPGAKSIAILGDEDCQYMALQNADGSELYGIWGPTMGSTYTIDGNTITLGGFTAMEGVTVAIPAGTTKLYIEDYGTLAIDGEGDYLETMEFVADIPAAAQPFMLTSVSNNDVEGSVVGVEASEDGVFYQFNVTATGKALSKGTATPTLSLLEDATVDFGAANIIAYEAETAFIRFMTPQQYYFTQPGTYVLTIPEGTFVDAEGTPNAAVIAKWVVIENGPKDIVIEGSQVGKVVEGKNTYYTTTVKFQKPEGAKYAYSEGLFVELNGEKSTVPFSLGQYGTVELEDENEVTLVYTDKLPAATTDLDYEGDLRSVGTYVATTTITFMDEDYKEIMNGNEPLKAVYTGTVVLTDVSAVADANWVGIEDDAIVEDMINVGVTLQLPNLNIEETDMIAVQGWLVDNSKEVEDDMDTNQYEFSAIGGFDVEAGVPSVTILAEHPALVKGHTYTVTVLGIYAGADEESLAPVWGSQTGTELTKSFYVIPNPYVSYAALTVEGSEDIAIDMAAPSVEAADGIAVRFDGFIPRNATYAIDCVDRETGDVVYSVASGALNNGFASFGNTKFISGYQYTATINAWEGDMINDNLEVLEPTVSEVFTFHGANGVGIVGEPVWAVERGELSDDLVNLGVKVSFPEVLLPGLVDANAVEATVSATLYGVPQGNEPMPISGEDELDDNMGVDGPVELATELFTLTNEGGVWSAYLFPEVLETYNHYALQLNAVTFVEGEEIVAELEDAGAYSVEFDVVPAAHEVVLGEAVINVDGQELAATDVEANGIVLAFPFAENVTDETEIKVVADLAVTVPGYGMGNEDEDAGFGAPQFEVALEDVEFEGGINLETGVVEVPMTDFTQYVVEAGAGQYIINVKSILVNGLDVYSSEDETADPIGAMFAVVETFEVEATAEVAQTAADQWGDQHYQVIVTVENSDNEVSAAGVAYAYTEGVIFTDPNTFMPFTFACDSYEGVAVNEDEDVVLTCTDAAVSQTTDTAFEGEVRAEGTYSAYCIVNLVDANFNEVGTARYSGELTFSKDITTGINTVKFNVTDVKYNLAGQRVNNAKGIVIMNGKKVVLK